jgi:hypothetical protein
MKPAPSSPKSLWPYAIIGWFVLAIIATVIWVSFALRQRTDLVRADYYEHEIRHQEQIEREVRTKSVRGQLRAAYDLEQNAIVLSLPAEHVRQPITGSIQLYRPSDARLDRQIDLSVDASGVQKLDARALRAGLWKIKVKWSVGGQDFFFDQPVVVAGT